MAHTHNHDEEHQHGHGHNHALPDKFGTALKLGMALNLAYLTLEIAYGHYIDSIALISDGFHNLTDVLGLAFAWLAFYLAHKKPAGNYTYGYGRATILAAFLNAVLLLVAVGAIGWEAFQRIQKPMPVPGLPVVWVAVLGILVNAGTALLFMRGREHDINIRGAFLHMATDAVVSLGVLLSGLLMYFTGWLWPDPVISIVVLLTIVFGTWSLFHDSLRQLMDSVPSHIALEEVRALILAQEGVLSTHDLHIWNITTSKTALTAHIIIRQGTNPSQLLDKLHHLLEDKFELSHTTIQMENEGGEVCEVNC